MIKVCKQIYYDLLHSKYLRNLFILTSGVGFSQFIPLLLLPILTRFFTPLDFGLFALLMAIIQLLSITTTLRLEMAIVLPKRDSDAVFLCLMSFFSLLFFSVFIFIVLFISSDYIPQAVYQKFSFNSSIIYLIPLGSFILGLYNILYSWNNRMELYKNMSYSQITHSIFSTPASILLYFSPLKSIGLILGQLLGRAVACVLLLKSIIINMKSLNISYFHRDVYILLKKYKKFILFETPQSILNFLCQKYIVGFFSAFFGLSILGVFDLADKIIGKPLGIISNSFKTVFYKRLTTAKNKINIFKKSIMLMTIISCVLTLPFYIIPDSFFVNLLGVEWADTGKYIKLICPLLFTRFIFNVVSPSISYALQNHYLFIWQIIYFILLVLLFFFIKNYNVESVLLTYSIFGASMYMLLGLMSFVVLKKHISN